MTSQLAVDQKSTVYFRMSLNKMAKETTSNFLIFFRETVSLPLSYKRTSFLFTSHVFYTFLMNYLPWVYFCCHLFLFIYILEHHLSILISLVPTFLRCKLRVLRSPKFFLPLKFYIVTVDKLSSGMLPWSTETRLIVSNQ